jgi:two-component system cell cycle sensor histidine kinase/response regulator CckA
MSSSTFLAREGRHAGAGLARTTLRERLKTVWGSALLAAVYFAAAKLGLLAAVAQPVVSSAWPPAGIALAALLLFSVRLWPGIALGAFLLNASAGVSIAGAAGIAAGNTLEAVVGALLLTRAAHFRPSLERLRDVLALALFGGVVSTAVSATIGVVSLWLSGAITPAATRQLWLVWWSGDAIGVLVITPLLLTWATAHRSATMSSIPRVLEAAVLFVALTTLTLLLFRNPFNYAYVVFPVVGWVAVRLGLRGVASATVLVSFIAIWWTVLGLGPFAGGETPTQNLFLLQTFIGLLAVSGLVFAAVIAERQKADEAREVLERRYRDLAASAPIGIYRSTGDGRLLDVNDAFVRLLGYGNQAELLDLDIGREIYFDSADRERLIAEMDTRGNTADFEVQLRRRDGTPTWVRINSRAIRGASGRIEHFEGFVHDMSRRKHAEEALRLSEERYRLLFDNNPQPMWVFEEESYRFLAVNQAACQHYGYSRDEFLNMTILEIRPLDDVPKLVGHLSDDARDNLRAGTWRHRRKDGTVIDVDITAHPLVFDGHNAHLVLAMDVTERRRLEQQLRQSQKMEAIGRLAGSVAHDFNNLLTAILGYADLLKTDIGDRRESIAEIEKAGERAATLTRQLLAFSRQQVLEPKVLQVNGLVESLEKMLRRLIGEDVELVTVLEPEAWKVRADAGQLDQVIMNLAVNARDAMPKGGILTIETKNVRLDELYAPELATLRSGEYVMLAVTDTGVGMSSEVKSHIFEPFFTTKGVGKGTGLGLATVYGIIKQSDGFIWVYSEPGLGTSFKIYLPRVEAALDDTLSRKRPDAMTGGSETVLLVEDEQAVRTLARKLLERLGYRVLEVGDGASALEAARRHDGPIDLLLTDVVMPELSGADLAARLVALRPDTRVLFMSGYTDDAIVRHGLVREGGHFLQKPFTPDGLARKLREVLDA